MRKKLLFSVLLLLASVFPNVYETGVKAASVPVVYWDGMKLVKGQVGKIEVLKPINLWKRDSNNKLVFVRVLKNGEAYRVYNYDSRYGGQYGLGGSCYITNMQGYIKYTTPPRSKLAQVNPEVYGLKLSLGKVTKNQSAVVAPGVTETKLSVASSSGNQQIYMLGVDQQASQIKLETTLAKDQIIGYETVSGMAERNSYDSHYIIGGVNGDYFDTSNGSPTDLTVVNGEIATTNTTPVDERTIFGVTPEGKALLGNPDISLSVSDNGNTPYPINSVNKRRIANNLVLYTPFFAGTTMTNDLGTEVVLTNIVGQLNGNNTVTATVKDVINGKGSTPLLPGEMVLSGHGQGSDYLKSFSAGDSIKIQLSYDNPAWNNIEQAIGGRYHLVKNGQAQTFNIAGSHPRTAIGIKADGSVFVIVIDGRQNESGGVSLTDLARVMKDLGAVEAMTFDGGGSSTMVVREPGDESTAVINSPSDGIERSVANSLLFVGVWKAGPLYTLQLSSNSLKLMAGATYKDLGITVKGFDKNNLPVQVNSLIWSSDLGTFNADGSFTVRKAAVKGSITAAAGSVKGSIQAEVVNSLDPVVVENFEGSLSNWKASGASYQSVNAAAEKNYVKEGKQSLKVTYDFTGKTGTSGVYAIPAAPIALPGTPMKIGMWVYGDGKGHWLRSQLADANNQVVQIDLTKNVNWTGWKYVEGTIPSGLKAPYTLQMPVRYMETSTDNKNKGQIFIDQITAVYQ